MNTLGLALTFVALLQITVRAQIAPRPGLPVNGWTLQSNTPNAVTTLPSLALDGDLKSRWTNGKPMQPGDSLTLDMGATQRIARLVLDSALSPGDYPRGYVVEASKDAKNWRELARATAQQVEGAQRQGILNITFAPPDTRFLRITNQEAAAKFWSVHELSVYGPPQFSSEVQVANAGWGRMIRLSDGHRLSVSTLYPSKTTNFLQIKVSGDNARTWTELSQVIEPERKMDNGELIQLPDGTILLSGRSVVDNQSYHLPVYRSVDNGAHWTFLSQIDINDHVINNNAPNQGLWEPTFFLLRDGRVAVAYANEKPSVAALPYSQICSQKISDDNGATWGPDIVLVSQIGGGALRPGMPVVRRMKNGQYIEVSEIVGVNNAEVCYKISPDGVNWPPGLGTPIPYQHAGPFVASLADGRLVVTSCSNELSFSDDYGQNWHLEPAPPWNIGFAFSFPAIYQTAPNEIAVMNTFRGVHIRFVALEPRAN